MRQACFHCFEARIGGEFSKTQNATEVHTLFLIRHRNVHEAVLSFKAFVRHDRWMTSAQMPGRSPGREIDHCLIRQRGNHAVQEADIHMLSFSRFMTSEEREKNTVECIEAGNNIGE